MLIFSVVIFVFSTLTLSSRPPLPRKVGGHDPPPPAPMGAPPLCRATALIETNALPLHQTANQTVTNSDVSDASVRLL